MMRIIEFDLIGSTNTYVKDYLRNGGLPEGETLLVTAKGQTAGRGRVGRSFSSEKGNGLYMTVAFHVGKRPEESLFITSAAAVAVAETLLAAGSGEVKIKWVNDIYKGEKKVCGILTEAFTDPASGLMEYAIVGVGINIDADVEKLPAVAGTLRNLSVSNEVLSVMLSEKIEKLSLMAVSSAEGKSEILRRYREKSMMTGREVFWEENGTAVTGRVAGIDDECMLMVDTVSGRRVLDSGYISVKPLP